jgi:hypothetical protein
MTKRKTTSEPPADELAPAAAEVSAPVPADELAPGPAQASAPPPADHALHHPGDVAGMDPAVIRRGVGQLVGIGLVARLGRAHRRRRHLRSNSGT